MKVFVIMQFDDEMDTVYRDFLKEPLAEKGVVVSRSDDPSEDEILHENIYDRIIQNLWDADYVIADLTRNNANVAYELGIAHTLNKRTIQISQNLDIPFDIKSQNVISYSVNGHHGPEISERIHNIIQRAEQDRYVFSNIVNDFVNRSSRKIITNPPARS